MIESYSFGRIEVDGKLYTADLIIFPERVDASWWRREGHRVGLEDIKEVLSYGPEVLVVGQGNPGLMKVDPKAEEEIRRRGIELVALPTRAAVSRYNALCRTRRVVAALHLTC